MNLKTCLGKERLVFYGLKLPGIYLLITVGTLMDFVLQWPFMILCRLDRRQNARRGKMPEISDQASTPPVEGKGPSRQEGPAG